MSGPEEYFQDQLAELELFFVDPDVSVLRLIIDPEMKRLPMRFLERRDEQEDFPHIILHHSEPFDTPVHWNRTLLEMLDNQIAAEGVVLGEMGADLTPVDVTDGRHRHPWEMFLDRAERLAASLPDHVGSLVFLLDPERVRDASGWLKTLSYFADRVGTPWLKFVVMEERLEPHLGALADHPKVKNQTIWLSPEEIENRADAVVAKGGNGDPASYRRSLATVGIMACARKDFAKAEIAHRKVLKAAKAEQDPVEIATALYNLGNTYLSADKPADAVDVLAQAADGCCYHKLDQLAPIVFTNLGVALHRSDEIEHAFKHLKVARDMFKAQNNLPGEAYVCDCLAKLHHEVDRKPEAEKAWRFALSLYDKIDNPVLEDVKQMGRKDILSKMKHFGYA